MTAASRDAQSTEPFLLAGGSVGCLLVHGLTGTPYDMRFLGKRLHAHGWTVHAVQLAGHAAQVDELGRSRRSDWYASVAQGLDRLAQRTQTVVVVGQSLGSLLALQLADRNRARVHALVLLSCPLILANPWPARVVPLSGLIGRLLPDTGLYVDKHGSDIADLQARRVNPGYDRIPLRSVLELACLQREVRPLLPGVHQPVLAIHARQDHTAPLANLGLLKSLPNLYDSIVLERSFHVVSVDVEKEQVADATVNFIDRIASDVCVPQVLH